MHSPHVRLDETLMGAVEFGINRPVTLSSIANRSVQYVFPLLHQPDRSLQATW